MRNVDVARYLPLIIKETQEFKQIKIAENPEFQCIWQYIADIMNDEFIHSSTENGVIRREKMLNIMPLSSDTLNDRKFRLLAAYGNELPYTVPMLHRLLGNLCGVNGYRLQIEYNNHAVIVKVMLSSKRRLNATVDMLERIVPQNMILDIGLLYNQHFTLNKLRHKEMNKFTHYQLRNEVIK